jgi:hypothetical protein
MFFLVGCDQATKQAAYNQLKDYSKTEIAGIVHLQYIEKFRVIITRLFKKRISITNEYEY